MDAFAAAAGESKSKDLQLPDGGLKQPQADHALEQENSKTRLTPRIPVAVDTAGHRALRPFKANGVYMQTVLTAQK